MRKIIDPVRKDTSEINLNCKPQKQLKQVKPGLDVKYDVNFFQNYNTVSPNKHRNSVN